MWAMVRKEFAQLRRDRRTLAMLVALPVLWLVVFGYAASFDVDEFTTVVVGPAATRTAAQLPDVFRVVERLPDEGRPAAVGALRDGQAVVGVLAGARPAVLLDGSQLFAARAALQVLERAPRSPPARVLFNPDLETSPVMVPAIAGMILVFVGTVVTSLGVVRERQMGTLEQLAVMPFRPRDVFVGKIAPYFLVAIVDLAVIVVVGAALFDVPFRGDPGVLALGSLLFLFVTLGVGVLISGVSQNQGQAIQLALMTLLPQVLLSGMIFPVDAMPGGIRWVAYVLPLTYFVEIARGLMLRGEAVTGLWQPLGMLALLGAATFGLAIVRFRADLAPSVRRAGRRAGAARAA